MEHLKIKDNVKVVKKHLNSLKSFYGSSYHNNTYLTNLYQIKISKIISVHEQLDTNDFIS